MLNSSRFLKAAFERNCIATIELEIVTFIFCFRPKLNRLFFYHSLREEDHFGHTLFLVSSSFRDQYQHNMLWWRMLLFLSLCFFFPLPHRRPGDLVTNQSFVEGYSEIRGPTFNGGQPLWLAFEILSSWIFKFLTSSKSFIIHSGWGALHRVFPWYAIIRTQLQ